MPARRTRPLPRSTGVSRRILSLCRLWMVKHPLGQSAKEGLDPGRNGSTGKRRQFGAERAVFRVGKDIIMRNTLRILALGALIPFMVVPPNSSAKDKHYDPYVQGPDGESGLIREVRHRLVMLPYYGVIRRHRIHRRRRHRDAGGPSPAADAEGGQPARPSAVIEGVANVVNNIEVLPLSPARRPSAPRSISRGLSGRPISGDRYGFSAVPSISPSS